MIIATLNHLLASFYISVIYESSVDDSLSLRSVFFSLAFFLMLIFFSRKPVTLCSRVETGVNRFFNLEMGALFLLLGL